MFYYLKEDEFGVAKILSKTKRTDAFDVSKKDWYVYQYKMENGKPVICKELTGLAREMALNEAKASAKGQVIAFADGVRAKLTDNASKEKLAGWGRKEPRARRILEGTATEKDKALVIKEATIRGKQETVTQLATKQVTKAFQLDEAVAVIDGMEDVAMDKVDTAKTPEALEQILTTLKTQAKQALKQLTGAEK